MQESLDGAEKCPYCSDSWTRGREGSPDLLGAGCLVDRDSGLA